MKKGAINNILLILLLVLCLCLFAACAEQTRQSAAEYEHLGIAVPLSDEFVEQLFVTLPEDLPTDVVIALYEKTDEATIGLPLLEIERMSLNDYYWRTQPGVEFYANTYWWAFAQDQDWVYIFKVPAEQVEKEDYSHKYSRQIDDLLVKITTVNGLFPSNNKMVEATMLYSGFALDERTVKSVESVGWKSESVEEGDIDSDPGIGCEILWHSFSMPGGFDEKKREALALSSAATESLMVRSVALYRAAYFGFAPLLTVLTVEGADLPSLIAAVQATGSQWPQEMVYPTLLEEEAGGYTVKFMAGEQAVTFNFVLTEEEDLLCEGFSVE